MFAALAGAVLGLTFGYLAGRSGERARRSYRDRSAAKISFDKAQKIMMAETRRATLTMVVVGAFLVAIFVGALNYPT